MSVNTVVTRGFGTFGNAYFVPTRGYTPASETTPREFGVRFTIIDGMVQEVQKDTIVLEDLPTSQLVTSINGQTGSVLLPTSTSGMPTGTVVAAALSADKNNFSCPPCGQLSLQTDGLGNRTITGLNIGQVEGQEIVIENLGTVDSIILPVESGSSSAGNRFLNALKNDITAITIGGQDCKRFRYMNSRWRNI